MSERGDSWERPEHSAEPAAFEVDPAQLADDAAGWDEPSATPAEHVGATATEQAVEVEPVAEADALAVETDGQGLATAVGDHGGQPDDHTRVTDAGRPDEGGRRAELHETQGNNELGWQSDCGVAATGEMLSDAGVTADGTPLTENDAVLRASALDLADQGNADPLDDGGTTADQRAALASSFGVEAPARDGLTTDELAQLVEDDRGVIVAVDARTFWEDPSINSTEHGTNHAVWVTDTVRDEASGALQGFVVNDTGYDDGAGAQVSTDVMRAAWEQRGGSANVTDRRLSELRADQEQR